MAKYLVIVEAPNKTKSYAKYLGSDYDVMATVGHVVDLPPAGINIKISKDKTTGDYSFIPNYDVMDGKDAIVKNLVSAASKYKEVYLMLDCDREGEAIAWHVSNQLPPGTVVKRASTNSITKASIQNAIQNAGSIDQPLVNAYEARRLVDRIVGYKCSYITKTATGGRSAGRVQSAALRVLAEREEEIQSFNPQEYWDISADLLTSKKENVTAKLVKPDKMDIDSKAKADKIVSDITGQIVNISEYNVKQATSKPGAPFTTSSVQQSASTYLGWSPKKTMNVAQSLYASGKCILPGEMICLDDGTVKSIEKVSSKNKFISSFDDPDDMKDSHKIDFRTKDAQITEWYRIPYKGKIIKIRTKNGLELSMTPDHKVLIWNGLNTEWKRSEDLSVNNIILSARNFGRNRTSVFSFEDMINRYEGYFNAGIFAFIDTVSAKNILINHKDEFKESTYYKYLRQGKIFLDWISNNSDIERLGYAIKNRSSKKEVYSSEFLYYFIGLFLGDGHNSGSKIIFPRIIASDEQWQTIFNLNNNYRDIKNYKGKNITFGGSLLRELMTAIVGKSGKKSDIISIPEFISKSREDYLYRFLAGLWDSDGCFHLCPRSGKVQISYTTISETMAKQLVVLIRSLGFSSSMHRIKGDLKNISIKINGNGRMEFIKEISPYLIVRKKIAIICLKSLEKRKCKNDQTKSCPVFDLVEKSRIEKNMTKQYVSKQCFGNSHSYWNYERHISGRTRPSYIGRKNLENISIVLENELLNDISKGDLDFENISNIEAFEYDGYVYDVSTSRNSFIANGLCIHNCTYHRTDSTSISPARLSDIRNVIGATLAPNYLPAQARIYKSSAKNAQEAHEAILPSDPSVQQAGNGSDERKLYRLVWERAISSQMTDSQSENIVAKFSYKKYELESRGSRLLFDGWKKVWKYALSQDVILPQMAKGDNLDVVDVDAQQKFTQPPPRYKGASLVRMLEKTGIGRPSTFASIIDTLLARDYIEEQKKLFHVTDIGMKVVAFLKSANFCFIDLQFTANMENDLDDIANNKNSKEKVLDVFYKRLMTDIDNAKQIKQAAVKTGQFCPTCNKELLMRHGKFGSFFTCEDKENCTFKANVGKDGKPEKKAPKVYGTDACQKCQSKMIERKSKYGVFFGCEKFPSCRAMRDSAGDPIEPKKKSFKKNGKKYSKKKSVKKKK